MLFILGISALIVPLAVSSRLIRWDVPLMILASLLLLLLGLDGRIGRLDGLLLCGGLLAYLFNILCVLGLTGALAPSGVAVSPAALRFDIPVMIAVAAACLPIFFTGNVIARWEGGLFFGYYIAYTTYLVLAGNPATITRTFGTIMIAFVIPETVITLNLGVFRALRDRVNRRNAE